MKRILNFSAILFILASCNTEPAYVINGTVADSTETTIYLQQQVDGAFVNVDSALMKNGGFTLSGSIVVPDAYYLSKGPRDKALFFLENTDFTIHSDTSLISESIIEGGAVQTLYNDYQEKYQRLYQYMLDEYQRARGMEAGEEQEALMAEVDSLYENVQLFQETFVLENSVSPVGAYVLSRIQYGKDAVELEDLLMKLDTALATTQSYQFLSKRVEALKKVAIGATAPDFTQNDPGGSPISFSDIYSQNKLTLIDFWASWCGPCRQENPNVVAAYKKYNKKGFTVFGVSLDNNKERWLEAIEKDELTWKHVSDLQGWGNLVAKEYAVNSIPASFLVDESGKIVAANARGEELHEKIEAFLSEE